MTLRAAALLALIVSAGTAAAAEPIWMALLADQLKAERACLLDALVSQRTFELAGATVIEGRARCLDGREFDFTRPKPHLKFELRMCQPAVC